MSLLYFPVRSGTPTPPQFGADPLGVNDSNFGFTQAVLSIANSRQVLKAVPGDIYRIATDLTLTSSPQVYDMTGARILVEAKITFLNSPTVWIIGGDWEFAAGLDASDALVFDECDNVWLDFVHLKGATATQPIVKSIGVTDLRFHNGFLENVELQFAAKLVYSSVKEGTNVTRTPGGGGEFIEYGAAVEVEHMPVPTMAALRALSVPGSAVSRKRIGYYSAGDGGDMEYFWNGGDTRADNGGHIIQPDSAPASGRWNGIQPDNRFNAKAWGCKGDGSNDSTRAQAMMNAINVQLGGRAYFPHTNVGATPWYVLTDVRVYSHTTVEGDSYQWPFDAYGGTQIKIGTGGTGSSVFYCEDAINPQFKNLHLVGPGDYASQLSKCIQAYGNSTYMLVEGCGIRAFTLAGVFLGNGSNTCVVKDSLIFAAHADIDDLDSAGLGPIGALQIESGENWVSKCQISAGHNQQYPSNPGLKMCSLLDKGFGNWYQHSVFDFGDIGAYVAGPWAKFDFCRAGRCYGHCWYLHDLLGAGTVAGVRFNHCDANHDSGWSHGSNLFDGFHISDASGLIAGTIADHIVVTGDDHRYGWYEGGQDGAGGGVNQGTTLRNFKCAGELTAKWAGRNSLVPGPIWENPQWVTAGDGDTTPNVSGITHLVLANTSLTTYTDFDNSSNNQELFLYSVNANAKLQHNGTTMVMPGAADYSIPTNSGVHLTKIGSTWIKV